MPSPRNKERLFSLINYLVEYTPHFADKDVKVAKTPQ